jgi:hypothetical protein
MVQIHSPRLKMNNRSASVLSGSGLFPQSKKDQVRARPSQVAPCQYINFSANWICRDVVDVFVITPADEL